MVSQQMFAVGRPFTFVIAGCPVVLTWWGCSFELRPQGEIWRGNAAEVGEIFRIVLDSGRPVTVLLAGLWVADEAGAEAIGHALAAAREVGVEWTVRDRPPSGAVPASVPGPVDVDSACNVAPARVGLLAWLRRHRLARVRRPARPDVQASAAAPQHKRPEVDVATPASDVRDAA